MQETELAQAQNAATQMLDAQKSKTGVGILGQPLDTLANDPKFQGAIAVDSIKAGEIMAHAALSCELLVCNVSDIPHTQRYKYIGRSQYPKFKSKPLISKSNTNRYACPHVMYWGALKNNTRALSLSLPLQSTIPAATKTLFTEVEEQLAEIEEHLVGVSEELVVDVKAIPPTLEFADKKIGYRMASSAARCFKHFVDIPAHAIF